MAVPLIMSWLRLCSVNIKKDRIRKLGSEKDTDFNRPHFSLCSTAKTNDKSTNLRKNASIGISDVVTASVYSKKTCMKKLMMKMTIIIIIIIMNKSQETTVFHGPRN